MVSTILLLALAAGAQPGSCCERADCCPSERTLRAHVARHAGYYKRLYRGYYVRPPYDYRIDFDYPSFSGPSRMHWPIAPPGSVDWPYGHEVEVFESEIEPEPSWRVRQIVESPPTSQRALVVRKSTSPTVANSLRDAKNPLR